MALESLERENVVGFLKKWSAVDNAFVDDFFGQVDPAAPSDELNVDLDHASKWLRVKKFNLMKTLRASYTEGRDFAVGKPHEASKGRGRNTRKLVLLTPDCFKMLCMQSRSPQADRVRTYFLAVEKTLIRYREEITESLQRRVEQLERNQKPARANRAAQGGLIYVIQSGESRVKMGRTVDFARRLRSHTSALADDPQVLYYYKTDNIVDVEACAKAVLKTATYRKYKEIYESDLETIKAAIKGCGNLCTRVQSSSKRLRAQQRLQHAGTSVPLKTFLVLVRDDNVIMT